MVRTTQTDDRYVDIDEFRDWAQEQIENSRDSTSRIIVDDDDMIKFRLREFDAVEDITVLRGGEADIVRFTKNDEHRQFASHRHEFTFHDKTMIVRMLDGVEICRAGTGTKNKKGPFPV